MEIERDIKRFTPLTILAILGVLTFFLLRPFLLPIIGGLILAYAFYPLHKKIDSYVKNKSISALLILFGIFVIIAIPLWFTVPVMINQVFEMFEASQTLDISGFVGKIFPTASVDFKNQMILTTSSLLAKLSSFILNILGNLLLNIITIVIQIIIVAFVFFYALRDPDKINKVLKEISPLTEQREKIVVKQFKDITNSLVYGQIIVGLAQGALAGLGLFLFGVPNALVLTAAAILISIIPIIGPSPVWAPVTVYIYLTAGFGLTLIYLLYNILIVSTVDNILRSYIVARNISMSAPLVLLGMIGGLFMFGLLGLILGPLILAYLITFWHAYKDRTYKKPTELIKEEKIKESKMVRAIKGKK